MPEVKRILILGGTAEARSAAAALLKAGHSVITSLAGVTRDPILPPGEVRIGGFGGPQGLAEFLTATAIDVLVDATHPFAAQISRHGYDAAKATGIPLLRLERPTWTQPEDGSWQSFEDFTDAAAAVPSGATLFLTTGRRNLGFITARPGIKGIIRSIELPAGELPAGWSLLQERPPFDEAHERAVMQQFGVTHLMTKNAGGCATRAKLLAARDLAIEVLMIDRPAKPQALICATVEDLMEAVGSLPQAQ